MMSEISCPDCEILLQGADDNCPRCGWSAAYHAYESAWGGFLAMKTPKPPLDFEPDDNWKLNGSGLGNTGGVTPPSFGLAD